MPADLFTREEFQQLRRTLHFPDILGYVEMPAHLGAAMSINKRMAEEDRALNATLTNEEKDEYVDLLAEAQKHDEDYAKIAAFSNHVNERMRLKRGF